MSDWRTHYADKLIDGDADAALVRDGMTVHSACIPRFRPTSRR